MAIVTRVGVRADRPLRLRVRRCAHGRKKVTIVHKANILKMVSGLFLEVGRHGRRANTRAGSRRTT